MGDSVILRKRRSYLAPREDDPVKVKAGDRLDRLRDSEKLDEDPTRSGPFEGKSGLQKGTSGPLGSIVGGIADALGTAFGGPTGSAEPPSGGSASIEKHYVSAPTTPYEMAQHHQTMADLYKKRAGSDTIPHTATATEEEKKELGPDIDMKPDDY